ncbi:MAG: BrnA antitoxin family protein [Acidobacteriaceae bacterium]
MKKQSNPELIDADNPEWTDEDFARAVPFSELPESLKKELHSMKHRGPQKAPVKEKISVRVSPDVLSGLRARGRGWQSKVDQALREWLERHPA